MRNIRSCWVVCVFFSFLIFGILGGSVGLAQSGTAVQGVLRDSQSRLMRSKNLNIRMGIFSSITGGQPIYDEIHQTQTSPTGTYALSLGKGIALSGLFSNIQWASSPLFLETSLDTGNGNVWQILSRQELLAVPTSHYSYFSERTKVREVLLDSLTQVLSPRQDKGEQIFNISSASTSVPALCLGLYYWSGFRWVRILDENGPCSSFQTFALKCNSNSVNGSLFAGQSPSGVFISLPYKNGNSTTIQSATFSSSGVSGLSASLATTQLNADTGTLYLNISGNTAGSGLAQFRVQINFETCVINVPVLSPGNAHQVQDVEGNLYDTVHIGSQIWLRENLRTGRYRNGDSIPFLSQPALWNDVGIGYAGLFQNNPSFKQPFGLLYNFYAIKDTRGVCPVGYKVPSDSDWNQMLSNLGASSTTAGSLLKKIGSGSLPDWVYPNNDANNQSGFTAFAGGYRGINGLDYFAGFNGYWWSTTTINSQTATSRILQYNASNLSAVGNSKSMGLSVRCLKE